jgi:hypothetical protein
MQRPAHGVGRGAVIAALSALLLVLSCSMVGAGAGASAAAGSLSVSHHDRAASTGPGASVVVLAPVWRPGQPHRLDGLAAVSPGEPAWTPGLSYSPEHDPAPAARSNGSSSTHDGRAPPA